MELEKLMPVILEQINQPLWGNWFLKEKIGSGSFCHVYRAEAVRFKRTDQAAVKIEPIISKRFYASVKDRVQECRRKIEDYEKESQIMYELSECPYIVGYQEEDLKDFEQDGEFGGYVFLIRMELLNSVSGLLHSKNFDISENNIIKLGTQIAKGVKAIHDSGYIHRDIKLDNLFISPKTNIFKLGDFNVTKMSSTGRTIAGTLEYIAPEIHNHSHGLTEYTNNVDIYSLGIVLYSLMNGLYFPLEKKYDDLDTAIEKRLSGELFGSPSDASPEFGEIILKACAFDPSQRYSSADELIDELETLTRVKNQTAFGGVSLSYSLPGSFSEYGSAVSFEAYSSAGSFDKNSREFVSQRNSINNSPVRNSRSGSFIKDSREFVSQRNSINNSPVGNSRSGSYEQNSREFVSQRNSINNSPVGNSRSGSFTKDSREFVSQRNSINNSPVGNSPESTAKIYKQSAVQGESYTGRNLNEINKLSAQKLQEGDRYFYGKNVTKNYNLAFAYYMEAAEMGNPKAQYNVGVCYGSGYGVGKNPTAALEWYIQSANNGYQYANKVVAEQYYNGIGTEKNYSEAVKWYEKAAEKGDPAAMMRLGDCYSNGGYGLDIDYNKAIRWYRPLAKQNNEADRELRRCYVRNLESVPLQNRKAAAYFQQAADEGDPEAQYKLGMHYLNTNGADGAEGIRNNQTAFKLFEQAANNGYTDAILKLGDCYFGGYGTDRNKAKAREYYRLAKKNGSKEAEEKLKILSTQTKNPAGVSPPAAVEKRENREQELILIKEAAAGNAEAEFKTGEQYFRGEGVQQDFEQAFCWYLKAARHGYAEAQNKVGMCYSKGKGTAKDEYKAAEWYKRAAEQGLEKAQKNLGNCYYYGRGVAKSIDEAIVWYRKAAEQGSLSAMAFLKRINS